MKARMAFIFMDQDSNITNKKDLPNQSKMDWKPILVFYAKTTSWIVFPLILATWTGKYVSKSIESQSLFFVFVMAGFGITCFGVYREIKKYKDGLDKK